jgi:hypothetical protein
MGVTSAIAPTSRADGPERTDRGLPARARALDEDVDPASSRVPWLDDPAASAAIWAAYGVDLREPLKPTVPAEAQAMTAPVGSVIEMTVLLNVLLM